MVAVDGRIFVRLWGALEPGNAAVCGAVCRVLEEIASKGNARQEKGIVCVPVPGVADDVRRRTSLSLLATTLPAGQHRVSRVTARRSNDAKDLRIGTER